MLNRFLRIYPLYWIVILATLFGLLVWPQFFNNVYSLIRLPRSGSEWMANITLFRLTDSLTILAPPAWSLFVEMAFYCVIAIIGRWRMGVFLWFAGSVIYTFWMVERGLPFAERYYPLTAASLYFSTGAVLYYFSCLSRMRFSKVKYWPFLFAVFSIFPLTIEYFGGDRLWVGYYGAAALFVVTFAALLNRGDLQGSRLDRYLGDMAYPIFLTHFFSAGLVSVLTGNRYPVTGGVNCALSILMCILFSVAVVQWLEPAMERLRGLIRRRKVDMVAGLPANL